jgi:hypothetical protein
VNPRPWSDNSLWMRLLHIPEEDGMSIVGSLSQRARIG